MAVPSSGQISILGIWSEINEDDYTAMNQDGENNISLTSLSTGGSQASHDINTNNASTDRPDESTPHAMSEFYAYNHDEPSPAIGGWMIDDFNEDPTGTRSTFGATSLGDSLSAPSDAGSNVTANRPVWTQLGGGTSHGSSDYIKMAATSNANHSQWRTTSIDNRSGVSAASIDVSSTQFTWEFSFYMASGGNKDLRFFIEAGSGLSTSTWNTGGTNWKGYAFTFDDSSSRFIKWQKWTTSGTPTTVHTTSNSVFSQDAWQTCKITRFTSDRWKLEINGSTIINGVADSSHETFYALRFWTAKSGNGSTDNRVDWIRSWRSA